MKEGTSHLTLQKVNLDEIDQFQGRLKLLKEGRP